MIKRLPGPSFYKRDMENGGEGELIGFRCGGLGVSLYKKKIEPKKTQSGHCEKGKKEQEKNTYTGRGGGPP